MAEKEDTRLAVPHLRAWRRYLILSQAEVARRAGVGRQTVVRAEAGERMNFVTIPKLAKGLGIKPEQLLREEPPDHEIHGAA